MPTTTYLLKTTTHPNIVANYKHAYQTKTGKAWFLNDLFIYAIIEYVGIRASAEEEDDACLLMMTTLDWQED